MKRHVGKMINTDQKIVVVMMQIPGKEDHALTLSTDNLNPRYEQAVMNLLESPEGQAEELLYNILNRRVMPDTGKSVLQTLHDEGKLSATPITNIVMMPLPNRPFPLVDILTKMGKYVPVKGNASAAETEKYNQYRSNQAVNTGEKTNGIANNLLIEADMLELEAKRKREQAYAVNPALRPAVVMEATKEIAILEPTVEAVLPVEPVKMDGEFGDLDLAAIEKQFLHNG